MYFESVFSKPNNFYINIYTEKKTMVFTTNSHCKSVIISGTIFYSWDYYNHIVKSTITILYYIFLVDIAQKKIFPLIKYSKKYYIFFYYS